MQDIIAKVKNEYAEITKKLNDPTIVSDPKKNDRFEQKTI
jgi:hypothetical protein